MINANDAAALASKRTEANRRIFAIYLVEKISLTTSIHDRADLMDKNLAKLGLNFNNVMELTND